MSTISRQYKQTFNPIPNLWANIPIEGFVSLCFFVILFGGCLLYRRNKRKKTNRDVSKNKLFHIQSRVFTKGRIACKLNAIFYTKSTIIISIIILFALIQLALKLFWISRNQRCQNCFLHLLYLLMNLFMVSKTKNFGTKKQTKLVNVQT